MLNPETITVLDPACGSGHILVVAYDVLKAIYLERGYRPRDIPRLILEKNLYGLDIDDRAAQLAGFALLMKARADDRRLFDDPPRLNVLALQESKGLDADELSRSLQPAAAIVGRVSPEGVTRQPPLGFAEDDLLPGTLPQMSLGESVQAETSSYAALTRPTIAALIDTFAEAKTFGSLIQIPPMLAKALPELETVQLHALDSGDVFARAVAEALLPLLRQASVLSMQFDAVVANPPYMGSKYYDGALKQLVERHYKVAKGDLYTCFMVRNIAFAKGGGSVGMITIPNWMFLSTFEEFRDWLFKELVIETLLHNGRGVFGSDFGSCAFTFRHHCVPEYNGRYKRLFEKQGSVVSNEELSGRFNSAVAFDASTADFFKIPGAPVAYWISDVVRNVFARSVPLGDIALPRQGLATADNDRFVRRWFEVNVNRIGFSTNDNTDATASKKKWFPYNKGGEFRRWFGNHEFVVNWENDGEAIKGFTDEKGKVRSRPQNTNFYFREAISWSDITSATTCFRYFPKGFIHDVTGMSAFCSSANRNAILGYCNSSIVAALVKALNPTVHFQIGDFVRLPFLVDAMIDGIDEIVDEAVRISVDDWNRSETAWGFLRFWDRQEFSASRLELSWSSWLEKAQQCRNKLQALEEENNRLFIEAYGLQGELSPHVPDEQITLARADREKDCQRLISYAIGCMMGRYSLDQPGLIYAHAGNVGFDPSRYTRFPADADGILPVTDEHWFEDDAPARVREFLQAVWGPDTLAENLAWLAESLGTKGSETPEETIRRYIADKFYKNHLQTYKKRPIYWLFSSGKQGAFQALVYLHRYHEGTLARMRMEYVVPLQGKLAARIDKLGDDIQAASSSAQAKRLQKERDQLAKQLEELRRYDEQLRHYADQRIALDLDDGVKVNYAKFGNLLAEVKTVTGTNPD